MNRSEADAYYNDKMKELEQLGHIQQDPKKPMTAFDMKKVTKIQSIQKELKKLIQMKADDNKKRGRTYGDGGTY